MKEGRFINKKLREYQCDRLPKFRKTIQSHCYFRQSSLIRYLTVKTTMFTTSIFKSNYLKYSLNLATTEHIQECFLLSTETGLTQNFLCTSQDSTQNTFSLIVTNIFNPFNSFKVISYVQVSLLKGTCLYK